MEAFPAYQLTTSEQYVTTIVGGFSIVGSIIIILAYSVVDQSATTLWRTLMLFLSVFDLQQGLYYVSVGVFNYTKIGGTLCAGIGLSNIYSTTASYLCTACVAFLVNDIVRPNPKVKSGVRLKIIFLGYPFFVSILALVLHEMGGDKDPVITVGRDQYGCYINQKHQILRWIASYIPLLISWFLCAWFNWTAYQRLKQVSTASSSDENVDETNPVIHNMMRRLLIVPFGFIILRLPDLSFRLIELLWRSDQDGTVAHWAMALQSGLNPMQGIWNCVLLAIYSNRLRHNFIEWLCCGICRGREGTSSSSYHSRSNQYNDQSLLGGSSAQNPSYSTSRNGSLNGDNVLDSFVNEVQNEDDD